jgi:hypothetical protein
MKDKKQTAVDWLYNELTTKSGVSKEEWAKMILTAFSKAKEIEKEQIGDSYDIGFADGWDDVKYDDESSYLDSQDYYEKTYGDSK